MKYIHFETHGFLYIHRIVWTNSMKRLFSLVEQCYKHKEPMLLIGETGCGKTTVCQLLAMIHGQSLHILNCHQHTETADFLGVCVTMFSSITVLCDILAQLIADLFQGFRPVRERDNISLKFELTVNRLNASHILFEHHQDKVSAFMLSVIKTSVSLPLGRIVDLTSD